MVEAMRLVRDALGDDAIIVATREEEGGVRLTAAIDDAEQPLLPPPSSHEPEQEPTAYGHGGRSWRREPEIDIVDLISDTLTRHGTPAGICDRLLNTIATYDTGDPVEALSGALDSIFTFQPLPHGRAPRPFMLIGPPGAGKTLTVAKLAARATLGGRKVGVITTDTVRAGGVDQLAAFTKLLKLKLLAVEDTDSLADALGVQRGVEQVLIDSAGRNPFDPDDMNDLGDLLNAADLEPVLVLPAGCDAAEAAEVGSAFRELGARRLLLTRLDMTRRLGSLLAIAYEARLSFSDISATPQVAEGLSALDAESLARLLLPSSVQHATRSAKQTGTFS
ncbi:GTPase [Skermanella sp. TT6]|nr:GTPase [Skermanella sp. TT6]